jgi:hypothetical protein
MKIWLWILYCMHSYYTKLFHCKILLCLRKERLHIPTLFVDFLSTPAFLVPTPVPCSRIPGRRARLQGRIQGGAHKIGKNMIFWRKIVIFHTKYPKNFRASLCIWKKSDFFGVKSWFFKRNTPSARRNFFMCAPPP